MANLSSGYGEIFFKTNKGDVWTPQEKERFCVLWNETLGNDTACYGIYLNDMNFEKDDFVTFDATGRWTTENNFGAIQRWSNGAFNVFAEFMNQQGMYLEVFLKDEENGCQVLYEQEGQIVPFFDEEAGEWSLQYVVDSEEQYEYTRENLEDLGFLYWEYDLDSFILALKEEKLDESLIKEKADGFYCENVAYYYEVFDLVDAFVNEFSEVAPHE